MGIHFLKNYLNMGINSNNSNINYSIRDTCIFCGLELNNIFFESDISTHVAHYTVDIDYCESSYHKIPFNICICNNCKTPQIKYLGKLNEIYKINHADSTGEIMSNLHIVNSELILKYKDRINNIIEIGSSKGILADIILDNFETKYYIIEPSYFGSIHKNKIVISDFYENVSDFELEANTMVMSHVLEHFYEPMEILKKIKKNNKIENIFLTFPDLEYYINNKVYHVLNTEHTFYIDNNFLINIFEFLGFKLVERFSYKNHSIILYFTRLHNNPVQKSINFKNKNYNLKLFYEEIKKTVNDFNQIISENDDVYLWPASIHSLYLIDFGLNVIKLSGLSDNSPLKIGKKMYGTNLKVFDFEKISSNENYKILLNGGIFNSEVINNK